MTILLMAHLGATLFMTGIIWFVQIVHYPLFGRVGRDRFRGYELSHTRLTTWVVGPPMLVEAGTALLILIIRPPESPLYLVLIGMVLVGIIWICAALMQIPLHRRLEKGFDEISCRRLVASNWLRTLA